MSFVVRNDEDPIKPINKCESTIYFIFPFLFFQFSPCIARHLWLEFFFYVRYKKNVLLYRAN